MARSRKQLRQNAGGNIGIIFKGTATSSAAETQLDDTSQDSELDPGDNAQRLNGAGILVDDTTNLFYRQNVTYVPASQRVTWTGAISGFAGGDYEIHLEPLLHPLTVWPRLIDDALTLIRRLAFQRILFANRGYYDLSDYGDIVGSEQIRRAYVLSPNLLRNDDFATWATGENGPADWTPSAALTRSHVRNYPQGALLNNGETLLQDINLGVKGRRMRVGVWCTTDNGATATLRVTARLSDDSTEREVLSSLTPSLTRQIEAEVETTARTNSIRVTLASAAGGDSIFWAPFMYELSRGRRRRVKPLSVLNVGGPTGSEAAMRMEVPARTQGVGELALLLPYPTLGSVATNAADSVTTAAPDDLIEAAVTKRVLDWLVHHPQIPARSKEEYARALIRWEDTFRNKARLHMRKIAKTQELWEAGELN